MCVSMSHFICDYNADNKTYIKEWQSVYHYTEVSCKMRQMSVISLYHVCDHVDDDDDKKLRLYVETLSK